MLRLGLVDDFLAASVKLVMVRDALVRHIPKQSNCKKKFSAHGTSYKAGCRYAFSKPALHSALRPCALWSPNSAPLPRRACPTPNMAASENIIFTRALAVSQTCSRPETFSRTPIKGRILATSNKISKFTTGPTPENCPQHLWEAFSSLFCKEPAVPSQAAKPESGVRCQIVEPCSGVHGNPAV